MASCLRPVPAVIHAALAEDMDRAGLATASGTGFERTKVSATAATEAAGVDGAGIAADSAVGAVGRDLRVVPLTGRPAAGVASVTAYTGAMP